MIVELNKRQDALSVIKEHLKPFHGGEKAAISHLEDLILVS